MAWALIAGGGVVALAALQSITFSGPQSGTDAYAVFGLSGLIAVPEPSTWAFAAAGAGMLFAIVRRRRVG